MPNVINGKIDTEEYHRIEYIDCECSAAEHTLRFVLCPGDTVKDNPKYSWPPELYTEVYLGDHPRFWSRVWRGLKYMFGYKSKYGHWDCTIIKHNDIPKLRKLIDDYDKLVDEFEKQQTHQSHS